MVRRIPALGGVLWLGLAGLAGCSTDSGSAANKPVVAVTLPQIVPLSSRADMVTGGQALVQILLPPTASVDKLHVAVADRDVTSEFAARADGRIIGLISGLAEGPNAVTADLGDGHSVSLTFTNHKIGGPLISGKQVTPFVCATPTKQDATATTAATNASGLSTAAIDDQCNIATEYTLFYRTSTPGCLPVSPDPSPPAMAPATACFRPYNPAAAPADLAMTTTTAGVTVPYIVRVERGTLNRGIYEIVVLFDPKAADPKVGWKPYAPQPGWNGKVVYSFGASTGQPRRQYRSEQTWSDDDVALAGGFLVAINSMTDSKFNSNRISMSETVMMMKEKITKTYGEIKYVIGNGCSGGSINQLTTASIFPGLLDGIQPTCTYPDSETTGMEVSDCTLLVNFYNTDAWTALMTGKTQAEINAKKAAINGHIDQTGCHAWVNTFSNIGRPGNYVPVFVINDAGKTAAVGAPRNNCELPASQVYDAANNPTGVRCTGADHAVSILGTVPGTTHARDTRDNVGVQYGLKAFLAGTITAEEFVTLNEKIGGSDFDDTFTAERNAADADALATVYRAGIVSDGKHLANTAIIDMRGFDDSTLIPPAPPGAFGIHHEWRSFSLRARLDEANGNHDNHVMWRYATALVGPPAMMGQALVAMDKWLTAAQDSHGTTAERIAASKPDEAHDYCILPGDTLFSTPVTDAALCNAEPLLTPHASPRQVAGGPLTENILKCTLRPMVRDDYAAVGLTDDQFARLGAAFPDGVCDFSKPGVGQQDAVSPLDFSAGPGGVALPDPPRLFVR